MKSSITRALVLCSILALSAIPSPPATWNSVMEVLPAACAETGVIDISGTWSSEFGPVTLKVDGKDSEGRHVVSGTWNNGGNVGEFVWGRFQPATTGGALQLEYYLPSQQIYGYADFKMDNTKAVFNGNYYQTGQSGKWTLSRSGAAKNIANLQTLSGLKPRSTSLMSVAGKWDSSFGPVELESTGYSLGQQVKGKFTRADGKEGRILSGTFMRDPSGGILKLDYLATWSNTRGSATFRPDKYVGGRQLVGSYTEKGQSGQWVLSRPPRAQ